MKRQEEFENAVTAGNTRRVAAIFRRGVSVDFTNEYGQTAVFLSAWYGQAETLAYLLSVSADESIKDNAGYSAYDVAIINGHFACASLLKQNRSKTVLNGKIDEYGSIQDVISAVIEADSQVCFDINRNLKNIMTMTEPCLSQARFTVLDQPQEPDATRQQVALLIDPYTHNGHPGVGSIMADGFFSDIFLDQLIELFRHLPVSPKEKLSCSDRSYFCDSQGWVRTHLSEALSNIKKHIASAMVDDTSNDSLLCTHIKDKQATSTFQICTEALPHMRFLEVRFI